MRDGVKCIRGNIIVIRDYCDHLVVMNSIVCFHFVTDNYYNPV